QHSPPRASDVLRTHPPPPPGRLGRHFRNHRLRPPRARVPARTPLNLSAARMTWPPDAPAATFAIIGSGLRELGHRLELLDGVDPDPVRGVRLALDHDLDEHRPRA